MKLFKQNAPQLLRGVDVKFFAGEAAEQIKGAINVTTASIADLVAAYDLSIMNPKLICGLFLGAMMAFMFCAMTMKAVGKTAGSMVKEVRRQLIEGSSPMLYEMIQDLTGVELISLHSDISIKTGERVFVFTLAQDLESRFR